MALNLISIKQLRLSWMRDSSQASIEVPFRDNFSMSMSRLKSNKLGLFNITQSSLILICEMVWNLIAIKKLHLSLKLHLATVSGSDAGHLDSLASSTPDSKEELNAFSKVHRELEKECEEKGTELLVVDLLWGNLQQQTQQQIYSKIINHILCETSEALLVVSTGSLTTSSLKPLRHSW